MRFSFSNPWLWAFGGLIVIGALVSTLGPQRGVTEAPTPNKPYTVPDFSGCYTVAVEGPQGTSAPSAPNCDPGPTLDWTNPTEHVDGSAFDPATIVQYHVEQVGIPPSNPTLGWTGPLVFTPSTGPQHVQTVSLTSNGFTWNSVPQATHRLFAVCGHIKTISGSPTIDGTGWSLVAEHSVSQANNMRRRGVAVWTKTATVTEPASVSVSWPGAPEVYCMAMEFTEIPAGVLGTEIADNGDTADADTISTAAPLGAFTVGVVAIRDSDPAGGSDANVDFGPGWTGTAEHWPGWSMALALGYGPGAVNAALSEAYNHGLIAVALGL